MILGRIQAAHTDDELLRRQIPMTIELESQFAVAPNGTITQRHPLLYAEPGAAAGLGSAIAAMILDRSGTVRYGHADAARLFHISPNALVGRHVTELIPELPLDRRTPGYNLAYATFWAPAGPPRAFSGVDSQGRSFGVRVGLDRLELEKHQYILLSLRPQCESGRLPER